MSIINPSFGDLVDRLFILERKRLEKRLDGNELVHTEVGAVCAAIEDKVGDSIGTVVHRIVTLCAVNATIWQRTDEAKDIGRKDAREKAYSLLGLNDQRHHLVQLLDTPDVPDQS